MNDPTFSYHIVAWIDLLGQTEALERIPDIPRTSEERQHFVDALKPTFGRIRRVRELVVNLHNQMTQPLSLPEGKYTDEQRVIFNRHTTANISHSFVADSAMMNICLQSKERQIPPVYSIYTMFEQLSLLMLSSLAASAPIRGAIELGICAELEKGEIYGQAISRAHYIENKCAHYPRIVIGPKLANYLKIIEEQCQQSSLPHVEKSLLVHWASLIKEECEQDTYDGQYILSYLRQCKKGAVARSDDTLEREASSFIDKSLSEYRANGNAKLAERYSVLKDYFIKHGCWHPSTGDALAVASQNKTHEMD